MELKQIELNKLLALRDVLAFEAAAPEPVVRRMTQRGAMQWAIQFAHEYPGSTGVIFGVTAVSLDMLFNGRDGLAHCMSDRVMDGEYRRGRLRIRFPNGSQIVGYPATTRPEQFDGTVVNFVVVEWEARGRTWEALTRRIRPLPGAENNIVYIVDEADE